MLNNWWFSNGRKIDSPATGLGRSLIKTRRHSRSRFFFYRGARTNLHGWQTTKICAFLIITWRPFFALRVESLASGAFSHRKQFSIARFFGQNRPITTKKRNPCSKRILHFLRISFMPAEVVDEIHSFDLSAFFSETPGAEMCRRCFNKQRHFFAEATFSLAALWIMRKYLFRPTLF